MATKVESHIRFPRSWWSGSPSASGCSGEPMRIRLLEAHARRRSSVSELQEATGASQQNVSQHLGVLLRAGIVGRRKQGNFSLYSIADPVVFSLCDEVCGGCAELDELDALLEGEAEHVLGPLPHRAGRSSACCSRSPAR